MDYTVWIGAIAISLICIAAGVLGRLKTKGSIAARIFLLATIAVLIGAISTPVGPLYDQSNVDLSKMAAKLFVTAFLVAEVLLCSVTLTFPIERRLELRGINLLNAVPLAWFAVAIGLGVTSTSYSVGSSFKLSSGTTLVLVINSNLMIALSTVFILRALASATPEGRLGGKIYLAGLWVMHLSGIPFMTDSFSGIEFGSESGVIKGVVFLIGIGTMGLLNGYAIISNRLVLKAPIPERFVSSTKAKYKLLPRHAYLVEEPKPDFAFTMFTDILKGRCNECENDNSFECESIDCESCGLPCPCRRCTKYKSRPQGLIVTRQFANDIRAKYYLQTTPIIWLSTVQGSGNMDPAKLALLTDYITNFMEKAQNGVVLVDGIEYLVTSNDFQRVQRAIDRWTEVAMTSKCRLIISVDDKAFDVKDLATLERDRETVRPNAKESWRIIPERI